MFSQRFYSGPGRKKKLTGAIIAVIVIMLLIQGGIIVYALRMAIKSRVKVFWLEPYLQVDIQGADGYAVANPVFDEDSFRKDFEESLMAAGSSAGKEEAAEISKEIAESILFDKDITTVDGRTGVGTDGEADEDSERSLQEDFDIPDPGISNGDTITVYAYVDEDALVSLREKGFYYAFECDPVVKTAEGLKEAYPYDPFEDLSISFSGMSGAGEAEIYYEGEYPMYFTAEPSTGLRNGDTIEVRVELDEGYDLDGIVDEYHIMPTSLSNQYTVSGLYVNLTGIDDLTEDAMESIMREGREAARSFLEDEYQDNENFVLDDAGLYFAVSRNTDTLSYELVSTDDEDDEYEEGSDRPEEQQSSKNYAYCLLAVNYYNTSGEEFQYYYYVRFENLMLDDSGEIIADFRKVEYPHKPSIPILGEALGDGAEVSVPGIFSFRTLAGYETLDQLISLVIDPLETDYEVTSVEIEQ